MPPFRAFVRHHYFAEASVAYAAVLLAHSDAMPAWGRTTLIGASLLLILVAAFSKWESDQRDAAEREAQARRPMIQVSFAWERGEPKDKPFTVINAGDDEARRIQIHPIQIGSHTVTFDPVGQLLPNAPPVAREPRTGQEIGLLFRTLIDVLEKSIRERSSELKSALPQDPDWKVQLDRHIGAEMQANEELSEIPVTVSYENRRGARVTLDYRLRTVAFADVKKAELDFVAEG